MHAVSISLHGNALTVLRCVACGSQSWWLDRDHHISAECALALAKAADRDRFTRVCA